MPRPMAAKARAPRTSTKSRKKSTGRKKVKNAASRLRQKSSCSTRSSCSQSLIRPPPLHVPGQRRRRAHGQSCVPKASPATPCEGAAGFAGAAGRFAAPINGASFGQLQVDVLERRPAHLEAVDLLPAELVDQLMQPLRRLLRPFDHDLAVA